MSLEKLKEATQKSQHYERSILLAPADAVQAVWAIEALEKRAETAEARARRLEEALTMTPKEQQAYNWTFAQQYQSVEADYARMLARFIERVKEKVRSAGEEGGE